MSAPRFSIEQAERRLGPAAAEEARRSAREAPRFTPEQIERLRVLFESATALSVPEQPTAQAA
ncbi:hypothetical protein ACFFKE_32160 [Streptomyces mutabilis]|uniref:hypothetical protein n=1 Tax=Streptomyces mutabilis TaxID=67332 RepID=UPI0017867B03|nr:hypothetical protein [Streptomyces mutabilis]GGQ38284.1 hypothetical protein GCM10010279_54410 [Streptomyces mutabilis]